MYNKKRFDKRYLLILIVVAIALVLVVLAASLNNDRDLNPVEKVAKDIGTVVLKVVSAPFNFVQDKIDEAVEKNNLYEKYKELQNKEDQVDSVIAQNENLQNEVDKLKETLELNTILSDKVYLNATVVSRNIGYWYDEVTIDKGSKNGIEKGMAVVTTDGLIGQITKVSNYSSTVKLLSNENMSDKISVKIKVGDDYVYGLISMYDSKTNTYTVEGISENVDIEEGADVVTTGMGTIFPSGLMVGTAQKVTTDNFDLSKVVEVKASVNFDDLDYVTVLKRKTE
ncbi:cell shape-determining protein MreC [Firmicutes bacterium CAG:822]|nr:cell shape-determining protein MreC [Firmicutes bacterium CAG:822]